MGVKPSHELQRWLKIHSDQGVSLNGVDITGEIRQLLNECDDEKVTALVGGLRPLITQPEVIVMQEKLMKANYPIDCLGAAQTALEALGILAIKLGSQ